MPCNRPLPDWLHCCTSLEFRYGNPRG
ncbi:MAG: hypothetical protein ACI3ZT_05480 [Candidatus Cryptobacteroides sp.]